MQQFLTNPAALEMHRSVFVRKEGKTGTGEQIHLWLPEVQPRLSCWLCTSASPSPGETSSRSDRTLHSLWLPQPLASLPAVPAIQDTIPRNSAEIPLPGWVSWVLCWKLPKECKAWMQFILKWWGMSLAWSGWKSCSWRTAWFYKSLNIKRFNSSRQACSFMDFT